MNDESSKESSSVGQMQRCPERGPWEHIASQKGKGKKKTLEPRQNNFQRTRYLPLTQKSVPSPKSYKKKKKEKTKMSSRVPTGRMEQDVQPSAFLPSLFPFVEEDYILFFAIMTSSNRKAL